MSREVATSAKDDCCAGACCNHVEKAAGKAELACELLSELLSVYSGEAIASGRPAGHDTRTDAMSTMATCHQGHGHGERARAR